MPMFAPEVTSSYTLFEALGGFTHLGLQPGGLPGACVCKFACGDKMASARIDRPKAH